MAELLGKDAVVTWVISTGTTLLQADYRTFGYQPAQDKFEISCGTETAKSYLTGQKDFTAHYGGLAQAGGTALVAALQMGQAGTLTVQPEGTATGKQKYTFPCFCANDPVTQWAYNQLVEVSIDWQGNGPYTISTN